MKLVAHNLGGNQMWPWHVTLFADLRVYWRENGRCVALLGGGFC
jgi:hypothetical protein